LHKKTKKPASPPLETLTFFISKFQAEIYKKKEVKNVNKRSYIIKKIINPLTPPLKTLTGLHLQAPD
jgi:hypothetical protein